MVKQPKPPKTSKQGKSAKDKLPEILPFTYDFMFKGAFSAPDGRESLANFLVALLPWLDKSVFKNADRRCGQGKMGETAAEKRAYARFSASVRPF